MKYFLIVIAVVLIMNILVGCVSIDSARKAVSLDLTSQIIELKIEKDKLLTEKRVLINKSENVFDKVESGKISLNDAKELFNQINDSKEVITESVANIDKQVRDIIDKAKEQSRETGMPWWSVLLMSLVGSAIQVKKRMALGLSESGYSHKT